MKKAVKIVALVIAALVLTAVPVLASQDASNPLQADVDVVYPVQLSWALGTSDSPSGNYSSEDMDVTWGQNIPKYIWLRSQCAENTTGVSNLTLIVKAPQGSIDATLVGFNVTMVYSPSAGAYRTSPAGSLALNGTSVMCLKIVPLGRGYLPLKVWWVKED
jgi:hypothetical protein